MGNLPTVQIEIIYGNNSEEFQLMAALMSKIGEAMGKTQPQLDPEGENCQAGDYFRAFANPIHVKLGRLLVQRATVSSISREFYHRH